MLIYCSFSEKYYDFKRRRGVTAHLVCDHCKKNWSVRFESTRIYNKKNYSFCSNQCQRLEQVRGGMLDLEKKRIFLEKYGVESSSQAECVKQKVRLFQKENPDKTHNFSNPLHRERSRATMLKKYGVKQYNNADKTRQTCLEQYGVENVFQLETVKTKMKETFLKNGYVHPRQDEKVKQKAKNTCIIKYGVENPFQASSVIQKIKDYWMSNYGVTSNMHVPEIVSKIDYRANWLKGYSNSKSKSGPRHSNAETRFYNYLLTLFSKDDIERWYVIDNAQEVDFYIKSIDLYIEFDGVYWHGLDRAPDYHIKNPSKQGDAILKHMANDVKKNIWFNESGLNLFRITDVEFEAFIRRERKK